MPHQDQLPTDNRLRCQPRQTSQISSATHLTWTRLGPMQDTRIPYPNAPITNRTSTLRKDGRPRRRKLHKPCFSLDPAPRPESARPPAPGQPDRPLSIRRTRCAHNGIICAPSPAINRPCTATTRQVIRDTPSVAASIVQPDCRHPYRHRSACLPPGWEYRRSAGRRTGFWLTGTTSPTCQCCHTHAARRTHPARPRPPAAHLGPPA